MSTDYFLLIFKSQKAPLMLMTLASLADLAALLKDHWQSPLDIYRSLARVHEHQRRAGIKPAFPIKELGRLMGLDEGVMNHEHETAVNIVGRAYRASTNGSRTENRGMRGKPQRYVTEDGKLVVF